MHICNKVNLLPKKNRAGCFITWVSSVTDLCVLHTLYSVIMQMRVNFLLGGSMKKVLLVTNILLAMGVSASLMAAEVPKELNQEFLEALKLRDEGNVFASIELLEQLIASQPQHKRAELELAVAFYRAKLYADAQAYAKSVLSDPSTPDSVKETIQVFLDQVTAEQEASDKNRHRWSGSFGLGAGFDNNVNASPESSIISVNGIEFSLAPNSVSQESKFGTISLLGRHAYVIPGTIGLGIRPVQREWVSALNFYRKAYSEESNYNLDVITFSTGMDFISSTNWRASLAVRADAIRLGNAHLGWFKGINGSYTMVQGVNEFTFTADVTQQDYDDAANKNREGVRTGLGAEMLHQFSGTVAAKIGLDLALMNAKEDFKTYQSKSLNSGLYYSPMENMMLYGELNYRLLDYDGVEPVYNHSRNEHQVKGVLGATYNFKEGHLADWSVGTRLSGINNTSDVSIYDYSRTDLSFDLNRQF